MRTYSRPAASTALLLALASLPVLSCRSAGPLHAAENPLDRAAAMMVGAYSSAAQAAADPDNYRDVRLHMTEIWIGAADARWLYIEQAMASALEKPYRQRVYRLTAAPGGGVVSTVYTLPGDPLTFAGAWRTPERFNSLKPADLTERAGCAITLRWRSDRADFVGSTTGADCPSDLRGAAYASSEVVVSSGELRSWDRGFDAAGKQVWGADKGPYIFVKDAPPR